MCKWICCFFCYPKVKPNKKPNECKKPTVNKTDKQDISKKGVKQTSDGQPIESYYGEKSKDDRPKIELEEDSLTKIPESEQIRNYKLPYHKCNTVEDLMKYLGYDMGTQLGKGGFGQVHKCIHRDKRTGVERVLACKKISLIQGDKNMKAINREIYVLKRCKHRYIIRLEDVFFVKTGNNSYAYLFMEFADCDTLQNEINKGQLSNEVAKRYFQQIATALFFMHKHKIAHKDLKTENVLIITNKDTGLKDVKVADFGLSQNVFQAKKGIIKMGHFGGTRGYMAPEILKIEVHKDHRKVLALEYDPFKSDMWALGVCLFEMLTKTLPFEYTNINTMLDLQESRSFSYPRSVRDSIDPKADDLIRKLLEPDVTKRIDPLGVLIHPWIKDIVDFSLIEINP